MKSTNLNFAKLLSAILLIGFFSQCKKSDPIQSQAKLDISNIQGTPPTPNNMSDVQSQLRWIARGYPEFCASAPPTIFNWLDSYLKTQANYVGSHISMETQMSSALAIDLESNVYTGITNVPFYTSNAYDRGYFYDFNWEGCTYTTCLAIVDTPNQSLPYVFSYENLNSNDSAWGYFWNSGNLDSVLLTDANYDLYYIFQVLAVRSCPLGASRSEQCNGNGICEPLNGESSSNCIDCQLARQTGEKELKMVWVQINEDKSTKEEAWGQGKYELAWNFNIINFTNYPIIPPQLKLAHFWPDQVNGTNGPDQYYDAFERWDRSQIPTNRNARRGKRGTLTQKSYQSKGISTMCTQFLPGEDDINLLFYEFDNGGGPANSMQDVFGNNLTSTAYSTDWYAHSKGGTFHSGGTFNQGGLIYIPRGSTWTPEVISGVSYMTIIATSPGQGEITVKLAYAL